MTQTPPSRPERVLVTGGAGFIGRAVVAALRRRGSQVVLVDRRRPKQPAHQTDQARQQPDQQPGPEPEVLLGDLADPAVLDAAFAPGPDGRGLDGVVHLAAITSVLKSVEVPAETFAANVATTQELLERTRRAAVPRFVLASTNAVVGDVGASTIHADLPLRPLTPYGATKAAAEMLLAGYSGSYAVAAAALRFTNVYGPGMAHKDSFVPRLMRAARSGEPVRIHGDGRQRRDLVHVDDVVAGLLLAWDARFSGRAVLGSGRSVSVLEMVAAVRAVTGAALPVEHVPAPAGEMPAVVVDLAASERDLGYRPAVGLEDGLAGVWRDFAAAGEQGVR